MAGGRAVGLTLKVSEAGQRPDGSRGWKKQRRGRKAVVGERQTPASSEVSPREQHIVAANRMRPRKRPISDRWQR
jgi:hypothetical protein